MDHPQKDRWDKIGIILQPLGGLLTALAIASFGYITSSFLDRRQAIDTNTRLYTELMSRREESESNLRKDMFNSIIGSFLKSDATDIGSRVLNLELLAYNFHESLNLKPLFLELKRKIDDAELKHRSTDSLSVYEGYMDRLERVAREITRKQVIVLEGVGKKVDRTIDLTGDPEGTSLEPFSLTLDSITTTFAIDIIEVDRKDNEIRMELSIETPDPELGRQTKTASFTVSFFDFPMIDNTRLAKGQRCSVVLNSFTDQSSDITIVLFPGTYASLKEKPYYSEVIQSVLSASKSLTK